MKIFLYYKSLHFRRVFAVVAIAGSGVGFYWSVRLAWADLLARKATVESAERSLELAPGNSTYLQYAAFTIEDNGGDGQMLRLRTARVNPLDSANWIRIAAREESRNQTEAAERDLLQAFAVDRQFEPRWALANFYFRRGKSDHALQWARKTLEFGGGNLNAVFELCWNISDDEREIFDKGIPPRPEVLGQYLQFLDATSRLDAANRVAKKLLPMAEADHEPALAGHATLSLESGKVDAGISTWNGLVARGLLPAEPVDPESGKSQINRDFSREPSGMGFDWGIPPVVGVAVERQPAASGIRVVFLRNEPESCVIIGQYAALMPSRKYRLRVRYETSGMSGAGTKWIVYDPATKAVLVSIGPQGTAEVEHTLEGQFETPPGCRLARIELRYAREPGTVRPEGSIRFSHPEIEFAP